MKEKSNNKNLQIKSQREGDRETNITHTMKEENEVAPSRPALDDVFAGISGELDAVETFLEYKHFFS